MALNCSSCQSLTSVSEQLCSITSLLSVIAAYLSFKIKASKALVWFWWFKLAQRCSYWSTWQFKRLRICICILVLTKAIFTAPRNKVHCKFSSQVFAINMNVFTIAVNPAGAQSVPIRYTKPSTFIAHKTVKTDFATRAKI